MFQSGNFLMRALVYIKLRILIEMQKSYFWASFERGCAYSHALGKVAIHSFISTLADLICLQTHANDIQPLSGGLR